MYYDFTRGKTAMVVILKLLALCSILAAMLLFLLSFLQVIRPLGRWKILGQLSVMRWRGFRSRWLFFPLIFLWFVTLALAKEMLRGIHSLEKDLQVASTGIGAAAITIGLCCLAALLIPFILLCWRNVRRHKEQAALAQTELEEIRNRFAPVVSIDDEVKKVGAVLADYRKKKELYDKLVAEIDILEDKVDLAEVGYQAPNFKYDNSADYAVAIADNRAKQKAMIKAGTAVTCSTKWSINGSEAEGRNMTKRSIRMTLRAFNNESDVAISKVTWKNHQRLKEKVEKSFSAINDLNKSNSISISEDYLDLKLDEIDLVFEERQRKKEEAEVLKEERALEREEARAQRELQAEIKRQEAQETERAQTLAKAKAEAEESTGPEKDALLLKVAELEAQLAEAQSAKERALSMAQQTRVGHVYIISNIGSFGPDVFKIGMTRRVEPMERVIELGDASVPFPFDVHALIFTEDAPALERSLHVTFDQHRVNRVNNRKEFFRVSLEEIKDVVRKEFPGAVIVDTPDAEEYLQSLPHDQAVEAAHEAAHEATEEAFPVDL
jgi:hypothetical protein